MTGAYQGNPSLDEIPNSSGQGPAAELPAGVGRLNWGAFAFSWIWGLANGTYIALLALLPGVNLVMPFILLFKGDKWAWQNDHWRNVEHFRSVQRNWAIAAAIFYGLVALVMVGIFVAIFALFANLEPIDTLKEEARTNPQIAEYVGTPVEVGWFTTGSVNQHNRTGDADVSVSVGGPRASGTLRMVSVRQNGVWQVRKMVLTLDGTGQTIALSPTPR